MPTTLEATKYLQENGVLFVGGKAANAGGVATSALEMSQNSERLSWTFEEVDGKLKGIMETIYANISDAAKRYGVEGDYVAGANNCRFRKGCRSYACSGCLLIKCRSKSNDNYYIVNVNIRPRNRDMRFRGFFARKTL